MTSYGPGTRALAELSGKPVGELATKPVVAMQALASVSRDLVRLAADRSSSDPAVRAAADQRATEIAALVRRMEAESPSTAAGDTFRAKLQQILEKVVHDLEATPDTPQPARDRPTSGG